ncbi:bifunctional riboflavin kinase/FAD synthetase [Cyclobacterium xiamenense]|uniref:bifunctional riboflavin kinase/FAD synthetase n=1 Tax=Cyclobacterium xiamenense TaxID=1297121 RepID=UPI0012B74146|nr:bifunctional riboflavin kinase/FAD synthetase [Cyclobacterium xiamenense]
MKIYRSLDDFPQINRPVVTIGTFDGVHLGHQKILKRISRIARNTGGETVLITFWPHPRMILFPEEHGVRLLNTFEEKARLLASFGIDHLLSIPFTRAFSEMPSEDFIHSILVEKIQTRILVIGYDHRFGKDRKGSFAHLKARQQQYQFELEEIPREDIDNVGISSTKIRKALEAGDIATANEFLGRAYTLEGTVVEGDKIGRTIGFPTANIGVAEPDKLIPMDGAYIVQVRLGTKQLGGILNIGKRPTVSGLMKNIEVNILGFEGTIYGENLEVAFLEFLRPEKKFGNLEGLKEQLEKDRERARAFFGMDKLKPNDK